MDARNITRNELVLRTSQLIAAAKTAYWIECSRWIFRSQHHHEKAFLDNTQLKDATPAWQPVLSENIENFNQPVFPRRVSRTRDLARAWRAQNIFFPKSLLS